jgi:hypothetical protein
MVPVYRSAIGSHRWIELMRKMVLGFLVLVGLAITLFLAARSPHSDVVSLEMHEIDARASSLDI